MLEITVVCKRSSWYRKCECQGYLVVINRGSRTFDMGRQSWEKQNTPSFKSVFLFIWAYITCMYNIITVTSFIRCTFSVVTKKIQQTIKQNSFYNLKLSMQSNTSFVKINKSRTNTLVCNVHGRKSPCTQCYAFM